MNRDDYEILLQACGVRSALALDIEQPENRFVDTVNLEYPFATFGRTAANDIVLDHAQVSRRHAYFQIINGRIFCVDFKSRTGTHWDGGSGHGWVEPGQCVRIGGFTIRPHPVVCNDDARWPDSIDMTEPLGMIPADRDTLPRLSLQFVRGVREQTDWEMHRILALVGSARSCKVQLVDPRVSKYHCSLLRTPLGTWVIDLLGRGGIRVNEARVRLAQLHDGDELQVGSVLMRVECDKLRYIPTANATESGDRAIETGNSATYGSTLVIDNEESDVEPGILPLSTPLVPAVQPAGGSFPRAVPSPEHPNPMVRPRLSSDVKLTDQENLVNTLLYHFGQAQQQMAEQFYQAVLTMVQMFSTFHRDQMGLVRAELDRLHDLNQELVSIQRELARRHPPRTTAPTDDASLVADRSGTEPFQDERFDSEAVAPDVEDTTAEDDSTDSGSQLKAPAADSPSSDRSRRARADIEPSTTAPAAATMASVVDGSRDDESAVTRVAETPAASGAATEDTTGITPPAGEEIHAWLCHRMETIRAEQQTLWQKILTTVRSKVSGGP